jgi:lipopolysaccharide export system protein LptC
MDGFDTQNNGTEPSPALGFLKPRDTRRVVARSAAYSRMVGLLRWVLPIGMLLALAALIVLPMIRVDKIVMMAAKNIPNLVVENLHFTGMDASDQPYSLTAVKALKVETAPDLIDLEKPQGEITLNSGAWLSGRAEHGRYDQKTKRLWLGGDVQLFHDQGYEFNSSEAQVNLENNTAWGDKPVLIQGGFGTITGQGFRVLEKGTVVVITGPAHALLNLHQTEGSDKPSVDEGEAKTEIP